MKYSRYIVKKDLLSCNGKTYGPYSCEDNFLFSDPNLPKECGKCKASCAYPVSNSFKLHVTGRPANYSLAREWEKFLSLSRRAACAHDASTQCYTTWANFHYATRLCYANTDACLSGRSLMRCPVLGCF